MSLINKSKIIAALTNIYKGVGAYWGDVIATWGDANCGWGESEVYTNKTKNSASLTGKTKTNA